MILENCFKFFNCCLNVLYSPLIFIETVFKSEGTLNSSLKCNCCCTTVQFFSNVHNQLSDISSTTTHNFYSNDWSSVFFQQFDNSEKWDLWYLYRDQTLEDQIVYIVLNKHKLFVDSMEQWLLCEPIYRVSLLGNVTQNTSTQTKTQTNKLIKASQQFDTKKKESWWRNNTLEELVQWCQKISIMFHWVVRVWCVGMEHSLWWWAL